MIILTSWDKWLNVFDNENIHSAQRARSCTHITFVMYFMVDHIRRRHNFYQDGLINSEMHFRESEILQA